ncbi:hypothetical protein [Lederbergia lenta]|uniref:hypothetical protein n=1 Tax=Lederbergia lenta TaxID=1467 RepID=UPI00203B16EC|nr:hypothetical protein [Lederbergia lenta]MCM3111652.1 hypothetical protein [Lederbergia lenta]
MIKEAIKYIVGLGNTRIEKIGEETFSTQQLHKVDEPTPKTLQVHSLSGLVEYLTSKFDGDVPVMVHVESPTEVICFTNLNGNKKRNYVLQAEAMIPTYRFDSFYDSENFNIKMQSAFVNSEDKDIILKVVGNIKEEAVNTVGDDGISQSVVAKTGVATVSTVLVPNPVSLAPYRTFIEVEQPTSDFIFRMKNGPSCALFEADGGAWKLQAMGNIKDYLLAALEEEITSGKVVIIA